MGEKKDHLKSKLKVQAYVLIDANMRAHTRQPIATTPAAKEVKTYGVKEEPFSFFNTISQSKRKEGEEKEGKMR